MAFSKKTWLDRIAEYPTRRRLKKSDGTDEIVTVSREEGAISQEGDAFSAENMNDLEERVANEFDSLNLKMDSANANISKKQDASTAITTSNINNWMTSHIMAKNVLITTTINPYSFKEFTVSLGITGNYIVISIEPYVVGEALAHVTNHFLDGKGNVKIDVTNASATVTGTLYIGAWIRYIQL